VLLTDHKRRHLTNHTTCWTLQGELQNKLRFRYPALLLNGVFAVVRVSVRTGADNNDSCHYSDIFNVMAHRHVFNELEVCIHTKFQGVQLSSLTIQQTIVFLISRSPFRTVRSIDTL
jgi:hypothetical protein